MLAIMSTLRDFSLPEAYKTLRKMDHLPDLDKAIDWESLRPLIKSHFRNDSERGGRPNFDEIVMLKTLFLLGLYNISDEMLEKELYDRISFHNFLHYPEKIPDARTIWLFRERLSSTGLDSRIWSQIWKQLEDHGIAIRKGTIQDASIITADQGKHGKGKPPMPADPQSRKEHPEAAEENHEHRTIALMRAEKRKLLRDERRSSKTRRSKDGAFVHHNGKNYFGFKLHSVQGSNLPLIRQIVVTLVRRVRVKMIFACLGYNFLTLMHMQRRKVVAGAL